MVANMQAILLVAAMAVVVLSPAGIRAQLSSCTPVVLRLSPCLDYITGNVSTPSSQCCSLFSSAVQSDPQCICALITSGIAAAPSFGITVNQTQAFGLPAACSVQFPLSQCNSNAPMASPPISSPPPPGLPTSDGNAVEVGLPLLVSLLAAAVYPLVGF
ncbi:non-specific lipid transfer protein GPI-anchored 5-like [Zingiber officinale]|nr:non-specific lipid transfer protein GPI-anchored 5-like [Zingiber officinale]